MIDLFNATNTRTFEARSNYKMEISKRSQNAAIIYCRQAHIKLLASQSNTNPDKKTNSKYSYYISVII